MLTLKVINDNPEEVIRRLSKKHFEAKEIVAEIIAADEVRRSTQTSLDTILGEINALSKSIGSLMKEGKKEEAAAAREQVVTSKETARQLEETLKAAATKIEELLVIVPNLPHESVPDGKGADDNLVEKTGGVMPVLADDALPHWELAKEYDLIDFELGVKITGAGFPVYKGKGARLQRALINFFLDSARDAGFLEVQPPYVVNSDSGFGTGQLPDKE
ncbi:MAG: serine--tRNA ligase, partial [Proteiniphilum sp.]